MSRQLQVVQLQGRPFQVDTKREVFRSMDEPKEVIPFDRTIVANHEVHIAFDRRTGKPFTGKLTLESLQDNTLLIETVPQRLVFPLPENLTEVWPRDPMINIYGTIFKLDYNARRIEEVGKPDNAMSFDDMLVVRSDQLTFWYDQNKKTIFKGSVIELETNPDIVKVQILPSYRVLNLTPAKEDNMQTLLDIARSLREAATLPQEDKSAIEKATVKRARKRRGL